MALGLGFGVRVRVRVRVRVTYNITAFVAQLAARGSHNPKVAGSIPVESICIGLGLGTEK